MFGLSAAMPVVETEMEPEIISIEPYGNVHTVAFDMPANPDVYFGQRGFLQVLPEMTRNEVLFLLDGYLLQIRIQVEQRLQENGDAVTLDRTSRLTFHRPKN